jgi:NADH-quinone oxidoreductase subunit J
VNELGLSFLGVEQGGKSYLLPFEIVSVHLLVVLIAAAYLARAKRRADPQSSKEQLASSKEDETKQGVIP